MHRPTMRASTMAALRAGLRWAKNSVRLRGTMVAFANSLRPDHIATILDGEKNDGTVQGLTNPDNIQKKVREEADRIYRRSCGNQRCRRRKDRKSVV